MFFYFGRKARAAKTYPAPEYPIVIEPFAGSMGYSLKWRPKQAIGIERDVVVHDLWHRLMNMTEQEMRSFPTPVLGERTYDRWVMQGSASNANARCNWRTVNQFMITHFEQQRAMALTHLNYAKTSVLYSLGDYRQAPDIEATWFIDPPYEGVLRGYRHGPDLIDFTELAEWCLSRRGQVIICEGPSGSWLPFQHHGTTRGPATFTKDGVMVSDNVEHVLTRTTHARCAQCTVTFPTTRADARYCSDRCRQRASRAGREAKLRARRRSKR